MEERTLIEKLLKNHETKNLFEEYAAEDLRVIMQLLDKEILRVVAFDFVGAKYSGYVLTSLKQNPRYFPLTEKGQELFGVTV